MYRASSEIQEVFRLLQGLVPASSVPPREPAPAAPKTTPVPRPAAPPSPAFSKILGPAPAAPAVERRAPSRAASVSITGATRADRLAFVLDALCLRAGLAGAVIADESGFPLAEHGHSLASENLAVFTSVLGEALEKAGRLLGHHAADYISMDVDYERQLALKRFVLAEKPYFLVVVGPQGSDQRSELEVSIGQVVSVLSVS